MPTPIWSDTAREDLKQIGHFIGEEQRRPSIAADVMRQIREHCDYLARIQFAGTVRPDLGDGIRVASYKRWIIVIRPSDDGIWGASSRRWRPRLVKTFLIAVRPKHIS